MKSMLKLVAIAGLATILTSGCAVNRATATVDPGADLTKLKTMYVKKIPADSGGTNVLIAEKLTSKGVSVTTGEGPAPAGIDALVTYADRWMWDITMYMLELTVTLRDANTNLPLASGNSYHTSLTRLSPKEMVNEVIDNIYKKAAGQ
ncbi:MAG TPA: hypothetical protein PKN13_05810 [Accumulibacter sp.]|nr:hypothetical protein [Accumulibacter sp.]HMW17301.1 hypothetical protein [Accumulibacter sp.]HMX23171.1 hypothetical protein [Accumulibacter sp.]HMY06565.1 hypothetical protein [Accumulibacter sp.]HNC17526.1 hypothetical protein [Accumulibacter sp.]